MIFWTLVFITFTLIKLIKGSIFKETLIKVAEIAVKGSYPELSEEEKKNLQTESFRIGWQYFLFGLIVIIVHIIYLLNAIDLDPIKYPTLLMIAWIILAFVKGIVSKKLDLSTEEKRKSYLAKVYLSKRTLSGTILNLVFLSYFGYMFYLLVLV